MLRSFSAVAAAQVSVVAATVPTTQELDEFIHSKVQTDDRDVFSIMFGDERGAFYSYRQGPDNDMRSRYCESYLQYSTSKMFTAVAIARSIDECSSDPPTHKSCAQNYGWDSPVGGLINDENYWTMKSDDPRSRLTVAHFLSQVAGLWTEAAPNMHSGGKNCETEGFAECTKYIHEHLFCDALEERDGKWLEFCFEIILFTRTNFEDVH